MKRTLIALSTLAVLATLVALAPISKHSVRAVYAQSGCTVPTLNGSYGFDAHGFLTPGGSKDVKGGEDPIAAVGVFTFDGAGNVSTSYTVAFRGVISSLTGSGIYTVNSGCTGSMSFTTGDTAGQTFNLVIIGGGPEMFGMLTGEPGEAGTPGGTVTFDAKKQ